MAGRLSEQIASLSQAELDEYLDLLTATGRDDSREFHAAYAEWERRDA